MTYTTVQEILESIQAKSEAEESEGATGVTLLDLSGEGGGKWSVILDGGRVTWAEGEVSKPDTVFSLDARDFIDVANSKMRSTAALVMGKIEIRGNLALGLQLKSILDREG